MGSRLDPNSDAWGGAWGSVSSWGGSWGWSWGPLSEVEETPALYTDQLGFATRKSDKRNYESEVRRAKDEMELCLILNVLVTEGIL